MNYIAAYLYIDGQQSVPVVVSLPIQSEMTLVPPISICIMLDHSDDPFRSNPDGVLKGQRRDFGRVTLTPLK